MKTVDNSIIRVIREDELGILEDMLYEAIYQPDKNNPIPRSVLNIPEVNTYIRDFGKEKDDYCLVAELDGNIIGAVWVRMISGVIKGYGYVDDDTPEFAISLFEEYRNQGIGAKLMTTMINHLRKKGYKQVSLSVKKENYAVKLYRKVGFEVIDEKDDDYLMVLKLNKLSFRPVLNKDLEYLCQLPQSKEELFFMFPKADYPLSVEQLRTAIESRFNSTVILLDNKIVGFANFYEVKENEYCSIGNVIVSTNFRNKGIASFLIRTMESIALQKYNSREIRISCFNTNTKALLLYSKLGYTPYYIEERLDKNDNKIALIKMKIKRAKEKGC